MIPRTLLALLSFAILSGCSHTGRMASDPSTLPGPSGTSATYTDADLDHLRIFLDATQIAAYPTLSSEQRVEMMRQVWASLDPTPTTDENERQEEHYRRLAHVHETFPRHGSPAWDKRGELFIRYGEPQIRDIIPATIEYGSVIPPREVWVYERPKMIFEMTDIALRDDFQDSFLFRESGRPDVGGQSVVSLSQDSAISRQLFGGSSSLDEVEDLQTQALVGEGIHNLQENSQSYVHNFGGHKLNYIFDVMNFATNTPSKTHVEVGLLLRAADLQYIAGAATVDVDVVAKTMDFREVNRVSHTMRQGGPLASNQLVADQVAMELPPGDYRLALQVRDSRSGNVGVFTTKSMVREFTKQHLEISDLQLASTVQAGESGHRFSKGDVLVVPHPGGFFPRGESVSLYFEVYGLAIPSAGSAEYTFTYTVTPKTVDRAQVRPCISISNDETPRTPDVQRYFSFNTTSMEPGDYDVEVRVTDHLTNVSASQSVQLRIDR